MAKVLDRIADLERELAATKRRVDFLRQLVSGGYQPVATVAVDHIDGTQSFVSVEQ